MVSATERANEVAAELMRPSIVVMFADAIRETVIEERETIAAEARRYASQYPQSSDGRNTFILLAEWIESRSAQSV